MGIFTSPGRWELAGLILLGIAVVATGIAIGVVYGRPNDTEPPTNPPPKPPTVKPPMPVKPCITCQFGQGKWLQYDNDDIFLGNSDSDECSQMSVKITEDSFKIDNSLTPSGENSTLTGDHSFPEIAELTFSWVASSSERNNESTVLVFTDNGDQFGGLGNFPEDMFQEKQSVAKVFTLMVQKEEPFYFPIYFYSKDDTGAGCFILEADGAPATVSVSQTEVKWEIFSTANFQFHLIRASSKKAVVKSCLEKLQEIYTYSADIPSWNLDFIVGSPATTQQEIVTAIGTVGNLATHYILSHDDIGAGTLGSFSNVIVDHPAAIPVLDYTVSSDIAAMKQQLEGLGGLAGLILSGAHFKRQSGTCDALLKCSPLTPLLNLAVCPTDPAELHLVNTYDTDRREVVESWNVGMAIPTTAAAGSSYFLMKSVPATDEGLKACFNTILNSHAVGIRGATCNLCGGDLSKVDLCVRWLEMSILQPFLILPDASQLSFTKNDGGIGDAIASALQTRQSYRFYMEQVWKRQQKYIVLYAETSSTVLIDGPGNNDVLFVPKLTEGELTVTNPELYAVWYGNKVTSGVVELLEGNKELTVTPTSQPTLFFRENSIFVFEDTSEQDPSVIVRVYVRWSSSLTITYSFEPEVGAGKTEISYVPEDLEVKFVFSGSAPSIDYKVARIEIFAFTPGNAIVDSSDAWKTFTVIEETDSKKYNAEFNFIALGTVQSVSSTWTHKIFGNGA